MAQYMSQFSYMTDAWAVLDRKPVGRSKEALTVLKKAGGAGYSGPKG